jgi:hypothetical protein
MEPKPILERVSADAEEDGVAATVDVTAAVGAGVTSARRLSRLLRYVGRFAIL